LIIMANKFLLILCALFFIALFVDVSGAKTFSSCNCKARAVQRCVGKDSQDTCVKRYSRRCVRRCEQIKKIITYM